MHPLVFAISALLYVPGVLAGSWGPSSDDGLTPLIPMPPFSNNSIEKRSQKALVCWAQDDRYKTVPNERTHFTASCLSLMDKWFFNNDNNGEAFDLLPGITMEFIDTEYVTPRCKFNVRNNSPTLRRRNLSYGSFAQEVSQFVHSNNAPCPLGGQVSVMGGVFIWEQPGDTPAGHEIYISVQPTWTADPDWELSVPWPNGHDHAK